VLALLWIAALPVLASAQTPPPTNEIKVTAFEINYDARHVDHALKYLSANLGHAAVRNS
jgi:hypothetical protein